MKPRRPPILELVVLGFALYYVMRQEHLSTLALEIHRASYLACQQVARGFGALAIELEKSYRVRVAP